MGISDVETGLRRREARMPGAVFGLCRGLWAFGVLLLLVGAAESSGGTDTSAPRRSTSCVQVHCVCARIEQRLRRMVLSGLRHARCGQCCVRGACSAHLQRLSCAVVWLFASQCAHPRSSRAVLSPCCPHCWVCIGAERWEWNSSVQFEELCHGCRWSISAATAIHVCNPWCTAYSASSSPTCRRPISLWRQRSGNTHSRRGRSRRGYSRRGRGRG